MTTAPQQTQPLVSMRGIVKRFGRNTVLDGVDLDVHPGEVVVLIGPSGAGKSTLLRCINGLERIDEGTITVGGEQLDYRESTLNRTRSRIGMVFQAFNLFPHRTVAQNIMMAQQEVLGRSKAEARARAETLLERIGLAEKIDAYPDSLSGGQQQRVAIARALVTDPAIVLADEPTGALDSRTGEEIMAIFRSLNEQGRTVILVTHERKVAEYAKRIVHIRDGLIEKVEEVVLR